MVEHPFSPADRLEHALRAYESALVGAPPGQPVADEPTERDLQRLRHEVVQRSGALHSTDWPRPPCRHCGGDRVLYLSRTTESSACETVTATCPPCWGTGLTLELSYRRTEDPRVAEP